MALSLKISLDGGKMVKTMQFDPSTTVYDACRLIREKNPDTCVGELKDYGLFLISNEEAKKGIWLEPSRNLDYYILRNGDVLEYNKKIRNLRVRMLDGTVKTLLVDDSQVVANLMVVICTKIGITNYDEYGLVREEVKEEPDPCDKPNYGTLTLKRRHQDKERDAKMDQLRKKLHTDDEVNWVEGGKTLREQGIEVGETLLLRRKLFYSDRNVDSRDPVQLALLYVQARDAILDGTHPVTQQRACEFAGIQCQIQFGDHKEDKHTTGFLDLKEFLPSSYVKVKGIEKKVFREHRKHIGLSELDAKVLYTKSARALNTYGVAFFLVKEKMKGKNKLVPRLLGVTKDSVLRLDEKTKETLQSWPLTTVRRWCASPNTFTLDFGDYSDQYYSVQTTEAEQILQVIAGYIDIILKRQRAKDHLGIEGDEGSAMVEDSVSPSKANIIQHDTLKSGKAVNTECVAQPGVLRQPAEDQKSYAMSHLTGAQQTTVSGVALTTHTSPAAGQMKQTRVTSVLSEPQRALLSTISSGRQIIKHTESDLQRAQLPELGADAGSMKWKQVTMDTNRQVVTSHIAAMNAATAQVVTLTSGPTEEVDHTAVGAAITTITSNLPEMTKGVQMIAALMDDTDNGDRLLDATRKLCSAFTDLLKAAEPETKEPRQSLLNAASRVGEASTSVLHTIGEETPYDKETQDILLSLAKAVANTTAALVLKAKQAAAHCKEDAPAQAEIIAAATHCALATSQLVACTKVVAGTLQSPACREQLSGAVRLVRVAVERLLTASASSPSSPQLAEAAQAVIDALQTLLDHASRAEGRGVFPQSSVEGVLSASERVLSAGDGAEMVHHARMLGQATAHLIAGIKTEAEQQPSETQRKLLAAAKLLADATAKMVEAARQCASSPQDVSKQETLRRAAEELRYITVDYAQGQDIVGAQLDRLQDAAKQAASSATQLITAAQNASVHNTNKYSQETLLSECGPLQDAIPGVVRAVNVYSANHAAPAAQLDLITASETFLQAASDVSSSARGVLPTVTDGASAKLLADNTHRFNDSCTELRSAVTRARISCKDVELDAALDIIGSLQKELDEVEQAARNCQLTPLPGQNAEYAWSTMRAGQRSVSSMSAQLVSRVGREGSAAAGMAGALTHYIAGVTAAVNIYPDYHRLISTSRHVLESSQLLVETVKTYMAKPETVDVNRLHTIANNINKSMEASVEAIPSHRELDHVTENINETLNILNMGDFPQTDRTYSSLQEELKQAAEQLSTSAQNVSGTAIRQQHPELVSAAQQYGTHFNTLLGCCVDIVGLQENRDNRDRMVTCMKSVTVNSSKLLTTAKSVSQDISRPNVKNELASAARAVTDSINELLDACSLAAPGQRECDRAVMRLRAMSSMLEEATEPLNNLGYFACLDAVVDQSKGLSEGMSSMASTVKRSSHEQFANAINTAADNICGLVEATAQAAYLVGVSDSSSTVGRAGLVDQAQFSRAAAAIEQACAQLSSPTSSQQSVLSAATVIAKHTSALCNSCRVASSRTAQTQPKRHFVQAAKDVANSTAALVKEIKALDQDYCEANRVRCAEATIPLRQAVSGLCQFADSPQFAAVPAKISPQARRGQESILECGRSIISASCSMIESAKALSVQPTDKAQWQALATHSKTVSDSIKSLVNNIREKAPGQKECAAALDTVSGQQRALDAAALAAISNTLQPHKYHTLQGYTEQIESSATEMLDRVEPLRNAAKREAENLGHAVLQIVSYVEPLVAATIGAASNITESKSQADLIDKTKTVLESLSLFIQASKHAAGNPRATGAHPEVESSAADVSSALSELLDHSRELVSHLGQVGGLVDCVGRSIMRLTQHRMSLVGTYDESDSFVDYQTRMVANAKEIARLATDMCAASTSSSQCEKLSPLSSELVRKYELLSHDAVGAAATTAVSDVPTRLRSCVAELGESCQHIIRECAQCRVSHSVDTQRRVADAAADVGEKVVSVLSALQAGSKGTQACIDGAAKIAAIIGDLETTILFASAGTLQSESEHSSFSDHRESILKTAKRLVEDTKTLVGGAAGSQQQLAEAAQSATNTIVALAEVSKTGAASLGSSNPELQVMLLHAARDVAAALRDLAHATKGASGKHVAHPDMDTLKQTAKVMVTNVTSLLKTVKAVEDEHTRGVRALESTIEAIQQEIGVLLSPGAPSHSSTAEELVRAARGLTSATATAVSAVSADGQQDQLVAAANRGRRSVVDLLHACKGAAYSACSDSPQSRDRVLHSGAAAAERYGALLSGVLEAVATPAAKERLPALCRAVAAATADLIAVVDIIKGSDWVDPEDPTVIAEHELLGAAASIDAAAKKLDALRPRQTIKVQEADESLNFDEMILEAAKSIIAASSALVKAASASQRELIDQGKVARRPASSSDDGQWSEGLVSAARLVAAAAHSLAESANSLVTGAGSEERLVSAARQVASSTAQLLVACKVKADPSSESTRRLQAAGAQVIRSTDNLVSAAKDSIRHEDERSLVLNRRMVGGIAQEIDARSEVLRIEKELEEARGRLSAIRQAKYRLKTGDTSGDDTDTDLCVGYTSDSSTQHRFKPTTLNNSSFLINTTYTPNSTYSQNNTTQSIQQLNQSIHGYTQPKTPQSYNQTTQLYNQTPQSYNQTPQSYNQTTQSYNQTTQSYGQSPQPYIQTPQSYNQSHIESQQSQSNYSTINKSYNGTFAPKSSQTSTFSSFKPQQEENKNYEGFTSRYETRLYDTPRPLHDYCNTEEQRRYESAFRTDTPLSPKFDARQLKFDEPKFDYKRDGVGQNLSETRRSTEATPGGTKHAEYTIKRESYSSHPNTEVKITTSTPKEMKTNDLVKIATPDSDRTTSPYGGPNYMQETTTELKEIPNGTQKVTTTKIYSSSPVTLTSTDTKYEPVKLEGIDELSKSFDDESRFSTLDSKLSSDTSRSFMRPSDFHTEYQSVTKVSKPGELMKEIDNMGKKFSQQTIKSETIERKSVMTSSHKSETQSTVTKKFGNF